MNAFITILLGVKDAKKFKRKEMFVIDNFITDNYI